MTSAAQSLSELPGPIAKLLEEMRSVRKEFAAPADIVLEGAPLMHRMVADSDDLLTAEDLQCSNEHYSRNLIYAEPDNSMSLYAMVWQPGQWTPVHDHGSWGLVAVLHGAFHERAYLCVDGQERQDSGIILRRGGTCILAKGTVTTFVPDPDHIHRAGVPKPGERTVTLHLYGRNMDCYNTYDLELGRRVPCDVSSDEQI